LDKAPDAFRTISEVADDLDIPQHVLRFWETRFAQIKPMKRSGGRRYYRPDDVDLLRGIRRLLYGEGYTIRGVQRILKEHGIKAVQGVADQSAAVSFGAVEEAIGKSLNEPDEAETLTVESDDDDFDGEEQGIDYRFVEPDEEGILASFGKRRTAPRAQAAAASTRGLSAADRERLERVLLDLVACRQSLDAALKDG
jgi:DNA-binding transcriptional MerR regulator